ncbi:MAG: hypothetical protein ACD_21C00262G0002, partial [uncultured bacterium]
MMPEMPPEMPQARPQATLALRADRENSMLNTDESIAASVAVRRVMAKYGEEFGRLGGRDAVIQDFRKYLLGKLGAAEATAEEAMAFQGEEKSDTFYKYRTALRTLDAPLVGIYGNPLSTNAEYNLTSYLVVHARDLMAYYWLAASDPDMELLEEDLRGTTREELINGSKEFFTDKIAEISRAHTEDLSPHDAARDEASCLAGTIGRLVNSVVYNPVAIMGLDPAKEFPNKIRAFAIDRFRHLSAVDKHNVLEYINEQASAYPGEKPVVTAAVKASFDNFLSALKPEDFVTQLTEEYGDRLMTDVRRKGAAEQFTRAITPEGFLVSPIFAENGHELLERIAEAAAPIIGPDTDTATLLEVAQNPYAHIDDLREVAVHPNANTACLVAVANQRVCDANLLEVIAVRADDIATLLAVARNSHTNLAGLKAVAENPKANAEVLGVVAGNPNCDADLLKTVAGDSRADAGVLTVVVQHRNCDAAVLKAVA